MNLPELGVRKPVFTTVVFIAILVFGIVSLAYLAMDLLPEINYPALSVITSYYGAGPQEIESSVTKPIEDALATVPNIKNISSTSIEDTSTVTIEFEWGTDLDSAANDVRDTLDFAKRLLPDGVEKPMIFKFSTSMMPIMFMGFRAIESYPKLRKIIQDNVADPLKQVDGVGNVLLMGGLERQIRIELDQARVNGYRLSLNQITGAISANNMTQPGGTIKIGKNEYIVRVPGEYSSIEEIKKVIVGSSQGTPIYLENVANVVDDFKEDYMITRQNEKPAMMFMIQKQSRANTVLVSKKVHKKLEQILKTLPPDVEMAVIMDSAEFIRDSINNLFETILWGGFFVLLVIVAFLIDWRPSVIIAVSIPVSLIVAFIVMKLFGYTINIMSLSSLAIAIGMVVDNAIVVVENIYRWHYEEKQPLDVSSIKGTTEVDLAISASTFTTIAIFIPVFFISGIVGIMFKQLAASITIVLLASLLVALWLTPMMAHILFQFRIGGAWMKRAEEKSQEIIVRMRAFYEKWLRLSLNHRSAVLGITFGVSLLSLIFFVFLDKEFFPANDEGHIEGTIELESGRRVEETDAIMKQIEKIVKKEVPELTLYGVRMGKAGSMSFGQESGSSMGRLVVRMLKKNKRKRTSDEVAHQLTEKIKTIPGIKRLDMSTSSGGFNMGGSTKPISVEIYSHDFNTLMAFGKTVNSVLQSIKGTQNVSISWKEGKQEINIRINKEKAQQLGLSIYQIGDIIKSSFAGKTVSRFREKGEEYDIFLQFAKKDRASLDNVKNIMIKTPAGTLVSVASLADFTMEKGPRSITRRNKERYLMVESERFGVPQSKIIQEFKKKMENTIIPKGVVYKLGGTYEQQNEAFGQLGLLFLLGLLLVYLIMAAQFESFKDSFTILFSVPFAVVGVLWVLFFFGVSFNVMSFVGMVMLIGIVVNNGIVLVDYINQLKRGQGMELVEAITLASTRRLRPILMTALTTIFGMLPMAISTGEGAESWRPLGISVSGGLFVSTMVTLIVIPVIYYILEEKKKYAGFWLRFSSFLIDILIVMILLGIIKGIAGFSLLKAAAPLLYTILNILFTVISYIFYSALMESSSLQATLGKWLLKIKVVALSDSSGLAFNQALKRNILKLVSIIPLGLGYLTISFSEKKQAWHDIITRSLILKAK